jgi:hypothetical protein
MDRLLSDLLTGHERSTGHESTARGVEKKGHFGTELALGGIRFARSTGSRGLAAPNA